MTECVQPPTCCPPSQAEATSAPDALAWFHNMVPQALAYAEKQKADGHPLVGIMCEYAPRELIMVLLAFDTVRLTCIRHSKHLSGKYLHQYLAPIWLLQQKNRHLI